MEEDLEELQAQIDKKNELKKVNVFEARKNEVAEVKPVKETDEKNELIQDMFKDGIRFQVANNKELQNNVLETAENYTKTKMQEIKTNVDTELKEAVFNNKKDACESYGFNEKTTPI